MTSLVKDGGNLPNQPSLHTAAVLNDGGDSGPTDPARPWRQRGQAIHTGTPWRVAGWARGCTAGSTGLCDSAQDALPDGTPWRRPEDPPLLPSSRFGAC